MLDILSRLASTRMRAFCGMSPYLAMILAATLASRGTPTLVVHDTPTSARVLTTPGCEAHATNTTPLTWVITCKKGY